MKTPVLPALTIAELQPLLRKGEVSPREVVEALQARIADAVLARWRQGEQPLEAENVPRIGKAAAGDAPAQ